MSAADKFLGLLIAALVVVCFGLAAMLLHVTWLLDSRKPVKAWEVPGMVPQECVEYGDERYRQGHVEGYWQSAADRGEVG